MEKCVDTENRLLYKLLLLTTFFNIWFPKAGIKVNEIPITVGNIFFAITLVVWLLKKLYENKIKTYGIGTTIIFFIFYVLLKYTIAYFKTGSLVEYITYIIPFIVYPFIYFITKDVIKSDKRKNKLITVIVYGCIFICLYGLLQYAVGISNCDIPGLTVNYTDYLQYGDNWFLSKNNGVDLDTRKIFSTYQNGNLFGINLLIIFPLVYYYLKKNNNKLTLFTLLLFIVCIFLTLSRSCWLGMVLFVFGGIIFNRTFKNEKNLLLKKIFLIVCFILTLIFVFQFLPEVVNRFSNTKIDDWISMSGRTSGLINVLNYVDESGKILPWIIGPEGLILYKGIAYEMLPVAVFAQIGIIGMCMIYWLFFKFLRNIDSNDVVSSGIRLSLVIWLIVGLIECAFWLPPTALNIYLIMGIANYKNERRI